VVTAVHVGGSQEEKQLAREEGRQEAGSPIHVTIKLDRETDDHGDFYVAFVIRTDRAPFDFTTFGSRQAETARLLATRFAEMNGFIIDGYTRTKDFQS